MANLNFQQPPRSIANASLSNRSNSGGFGGNSLSGHVTPTSGMFPPSNSSYPVSAQQPQLSPSRGVQLSAANSIGGGGGGIGVSSSGGGVGSGSTPQISNSARTNIFGQRAFPDRRSIQGLGPMSSIGSFMQSRGYGSQSGNSLNNFHSVFGGNSSDTGTPPLLDLSEFPSLTNARGNDSLPQTNSLQAPGSKPYVHSLVGMVKQPTAEQSEFTMSSEDFPALPGTQIADGSAIVGGVVGGGPGSIGTGSGTNNGGVIGSGGGVGCINLSGHDGADKGPGPSGGGAANVGMELQATDSLSTSSASLIKDPAYKRGVQTSPDGKVTNIPPSMVNNQFGMIGLLTFIRAAESDPNLVTLAMGQDLTGLGLNLNSQENLYPTFGGPFADQPCRPQDIDFHVPPEYLVNMTIRDKLASLTLKKYKDDLLFFLFYTNIGDLMQIAAAAELHNRDWRYHIEEKVWITRVPGFTHYEKNGNTERGTFYYFDAQNWRRVPKDFQIDAAKLDKCPNLNAFVNLNGLSV